MPGIRELHQRALFSAMDLITDVPVYDHVPQNCEYPYITIGHDRFTDDGDTCSRMWDIDSEVRVYTGEPYRGHLSAKQLQDLIADELPGVLESVGIEGHNIVLAHFIDSYVDRDSDGLTYFGSVSFRFFIEEL